MKPYRWRLWLPLVALLVQLSAGAVPVVCPMTGASSPAAVAGELEPEQLSADIAMGEHAVMSASDCCGTQAPDCLAGACLLLMSSGVAAFNHGAVTTPPIQSFPGAAVPLPPLYPILRPPIA